MTRPTEQEVYREFRRLADELDRTPNTADIQEHSYLLHDHVQRVCGGVPQAQVQAGLRPTSSRGLSADNLLEEVRAVADELGRMPKRDEFEERSDLMAQTVVDRTDMTWEAMADELGYEPTRRRELTRGAVVEDLRRIGEELGRRPEKREAIDQGRYSEWAYTRKFASFSELLEEAGFEGRPRVHDYDDPEFVEAVMADVRRVADELGRKPTRQEMGELGEYSEWVYRNVCDSWSELRAAAGVE